MTELKRTKVVDVLKRSDYGSEVCVKGWVRTMRDSKNVAFIALNDGSVIHNVQIVVDPLTIGENILNVITSYSIHYTKLYDVRLKLFSSNNKTQLYLFS